jgi:hypothetical protein
MKKESKTIYIVMGSTGNILHENWFKYSVKAFYDQEEADKYIEKYTKIVNIAKEYFSYLYSNEYYTNRYTDFEFDRDNIYFYKYNKWIEFDKSFVQEIELI